MPKKKLLVLFGAGSSVEQGMPSVAAIDKLMHDWASECVGDWVGIGGAHGGNYYILTDNYYHTLTNSLTAYYRTPNRQTQWQPNFEKVLAEMVSLSHWVAPRPLGNPLREIIGDVQERYIPFEVSGPPSYEFSNFASPEEGMDSARKLADNKVY
jgi:hypothetical protein